MSNNLPKSVKIGPVDYKVSKSAENWRKAGKRTHTKGGMGWSFHETAEIFLNPEQPASALRMTLWHEVLHATLWVFAGQPDFRKIGGDKMDAEHTVIGYLEGTTLLVLRDNPKLVKYLTEGSK